MSTTNLRLLSDSLRTDLAEITRTRACVISKALIQAHDVECGDRVTDFARMLSVRSETGNLEDDLSKSTTNILFSFLPKGKDPEYSASGKWARANRQTAKVAKIALALLETSTDVTKTNQVKHSTRYYAYESGVNGNIHLLDNKGVHRHTMNAEEFKAAPKRVLEQPVRKFTDQDYENFTNNLKAHYQCDVEFRLLEGTDIQKYYNSDYYYSAEGNSGTLWDSCMRQSPEDYFEIYRDNAKLLTAFYCDKVIGRALVWETNKGTFMDRVYYYKDYIQTNFADYAKEHGWMFKNRNAAGGFTGITIKEGDKYVSKNDIFLEIKLTNANYHKYPYMDTFPYLNKKDGYLRNYEHLKHTHTLQCTGGSADTSDWEGNTRVCLATNQRYHITQLLYVTDREGYALPEHCTELLSGHWALTKDIIISSRTGKPFLASHKVQLADGTFEYFYDRNVRLWSNGEYHYEPERVESDKQKEAKRLTNYINTLRRARVESKESSEQTSRDHIPHSSWYGIRRRHDFAMNPDTPTANPPRLSAFWDVRHTPVSTQPTAESLPTTQAIVEVLSNNTATDNNDFDLDF